MLSIYNSFAQTLNYNVIQLTLQLRYCFELKLPFMWCFDLFICIMKTKQMNALTHALHCKTANTFDMVDPQVFKELSTELIFKAPSPMENARVYKCTICPERHFTTRKDKHHVVKAVSTVAIFD